MLLLCQKISSQGYNGFYRGLWDLDGEWSQVTKAGTLWPGKTFQCRVCFCVDILLARGRCASFINAVHHPGLLKGFYASKHSGGAMWTHPISLSLIQLIGSRNRSLALPSFVVKCLSLKHTQKKHSAVKQSLQLFYSHFQMHLSRKYALIECE